MKTDAELNLIIATTVIVIISFSYACLKFDSPENEAKKKEIRKAKEMELQKRK